MNKPHLIVLAEQRPTAWNSLTWEQRQGIRDERGKLIEAEIKDSPWMTADELRDAMGPLYAHHADFKERPHSLIPLPNLSGPKLDIEREYHVTFWALIVRFIRYALA